MVKMTQNMQMNIRPNPSGDLPEVDPSAYVDPSAQLIGRVQIGPRVLVGPNAVIRADEVSAGGEVKPIIIQADCNIQDGVIIHALAGTEVTIGPRTSIAHGAIIHGPASIGEGCFVGFGTVVFRAQLGSGVFVGVRAVVEDVDVPDDSFIPTSALINKASLAQLQKTEPRDREFMKKIVQANLKLTHGYRELS